jgi:hypothetical protein
LKGVYLDSYHYYNYFSVSLTAEVLNRRWGALWPCYYHKIKILYLIFCGLLNSRTVFSHDCSNTNLKLLVLHVIFYVIICYAVPFYYNLILRNTKFCDPCH